MVYGPINDNGMWRTRYSNELYTFYDELGVVKTIKIGNCGGWDTTSECKN
jgi:hypothetical protein